MVKHLLVIDATSDIGCLSDTYEGTVPDKTLAELASSTPSARSCLDQDRGLPGFYARGDHDHLTQARCRLVVNSLPLV